MLLCAYRLMLIFFKIRARLGKQTLSFLDKGALFILFYTIFSGALDLGKEPWVSAALSDKVMGKTQRNYERLLPLVPPLSQQCELIRWTRETISYTPLTDAVSQQVFNRPHCGLFFCPRIISPLWLMFNPLSEGRSRRVRDPHEERETGLVIQQLCPMYLTMLTKSVCLSPFSLSGKAAARAEAVRAPVLLEDKIIACWSEQSPQTWSFSENGDARFYQVKPQGLIFKRYGHECEKHPRFQTLGSKNRWGNCSSPFDEFVDWAVSFAKR